MKTPYVQMPMDPRKILQSLTELDSDICMYLRPLSTQNNGKFKLYVFGRNIYAEVDLLFPLNFDASEVEGYLPKSISLWKPGHDKRSMFYATSKKGLNFIMAQFSK